MRKMKKNTERLGNELRPEVEEITSIVDRFGIEEHFMTDYGDETTRTDPWSLFDEGDGKEALNLAERCFSLAEKVFLKQLEELEQED